MRSSKEDNFNGSSKLAVFPAVKARIYPTNSYGYDIS